VLIAHARMGGEQRANAELRALHGLAAFCIHDLKNLAARLSLVAQNARVHGSDPAFQAAAMHTVTTTVDRMSSLIAKLTMGDASVLPADAGQASSELGDALNEAVQGVRADIRVHLPPPEARRWLVPLGREQLGQVFTNLVRNAEQALAAGRAGAEIRVEAERDEAGLRVSIADNGTGMGPQVISNLFRPFSTTKAGGWGIGLYQCRTVVEAAGGSLKVESLPGRGTTVTIEFGAGVRPVALQSVGNP